MPQINLENLKSSGVYTFEYDASQSLSETAEYGRLLIGSSKTGPFNTIVQLANDNQKRAIFGTNDRLLEKKGSYFHKSIEISLREGPVYAMNVLPVDTITTGSDNADKGSVSSFNTDASTNVSKSDIPTPIMYMFDRQKFWKSSETSLLRAKNSETNPYKELAKVKNNILLFSNASQRTVTVFVQKSSITGYDLTVDEWYKSQGDDVYVPTFLAADDLISDYMVNVIAVEGDWTNYKKLAADPTYSRYFSTTGLRKSRAAEFIQLNAVNVIVNVTGSLIPDFKDDRGAIISVDRMFNNYYPSSQLMCAIDVDTINEFDPTKPYSYNEEENETDNTSVEEKSNRIDIIGHGVTTNKSQFINVLSYKAPKFTDVLVNPDIYYDDPKLDIDFTKEVIYNGKMYAFPGTDLYEVYDAGYLVNTDPVVASYYDINNMDAEYPSEFGSEPGTNYIYITETNFPVERYKNQKAIEITAFYDKSLQKENTNFFHDGLETPAEKDDVSYTFTMESSSIGNIVEDFKLKKEGSFEKELKHLEKTETVNTGAGFIYDENVPNELRVNISGYLNMNYEFELKQKLDGASPYTGWVKEFVKYVKVNHYLKAKTTDNCAARFLKIMSVSRYVDPSLTYVEPYEIEVKDESSEGYHYEEAYKDEKVQWLVIKTMSPTMEQVSGIELITDEATGDATITANKGIQNFTTSLVGSKMSPFKIRPELLPNGQSDRVNEILKFLFEGSNLASAIAESEEIDIRYFIDTYDGEISASSKYYHSLLAATHAKSMVFTNCPSMKQFEQCADPKFIDQTTGLLNTQYIAQGGNLELNPSTTYKFASDTVNGVPIETFTIPCMPYLIINDGGVKRSMIPAPYVCNAYMRKFKANAPYVIIAGVNTGKLTDNDILGVEYEFTKSDRDWLEPAGNNLIIQKRRDGVMLFSNNTAYQSVKSALNNAHVRDILITIEKRIEKILFSFLFRYNTAVVRSRVKSLVDNYLETVKIGGGIASYETQIDETNNDRYVLENNSAILDIKVEFNRGIHKFVNRITITRTGGELSVVQSGFTDL